MNTQNSVQLFFSKQKKHKSQGVAVFQLWEQLYMLDKLFQAEILNFSAVSNRNRSFFLFL